MAIQLGNKTKLTTNLEKTLIEIGGGDPNKTLTEEELKDILTAAIKKIAEKRPSILRKIYKQYNREGKFIDDDLSNTT